MKQYEKEKEMERNPLISVIIPVYQQEKYLKACLNSVLNQSWANLDVILVDDGSFDASPSICDEYAAADPRVTVVHQENQGLSMARNRGLEYVKGGLLCYLDSDDVLHPDGIRKMAEALQKTGADLCHCMSVEFPAEGDPGFTPCGDGCCARIISGYVYLERMVRNSWACTCTGILYRTALAKSVSFEPGKTCEDVMYSCRVADRADRVAVLPLKLYGYRQSPGSIMRRALSRQSYDMLDVNEQRIRYLERHHPELLTAAKRNLIETALHFLMKVDRGSNVGTREYLRGETLLCLQRNSLTWKETLQMQCSAFTRLSLIGARLSPAGLVMFNRLRKKVLLRRP